MRTGCQLGWILASKIHQNLLLDGSWADMWPSWAVLGRLGGLLRRLEEALKSDAKKNAQKVGQKCVFRRLGGRVNEIMLALSGVRSSAGARGKPTYQDGESLTKETLHRKNNLQRVSAESECRE